MMGLKGFLMAGYIRFRSEVADQTAMSEAMAKAGLLPANANEPGQANLTAEVMESGAGAGVDMPANRRQTGRRHTGPLSSDALSDRFHEYQKLEGGLSNRELVKSFIYHSEQQVIVGDSDYRQWGRMLEQFGNMAVESQFTFIRAIAAERKLGFIPATAGFIGLATVLFPPNDTKWADCWLPSGKDTRIQKRMTKARAEYKKYEAEKLARAEADKARAMLEKQQAEQIAALQADLDAGKITKAEFDKAKDLILNPPTMPAPPKAPSSASQIYKAFFKLAESDIVRERVRAMTGATTDSEATQVVHDIVDLLFSEIKYSSEDRSKWASDVRKGK